MAHAHELPEDTLTFSPNPDAINFEVEKPHELGGWDSLDVCVSVGNSQHLLLTRTKSKDESTSAALRSWIIRHQIGDYNLIFRIEGNESDLPTGLSVNILTLIALTHLCFPRARRRTRKFFELSYYDPATGRYTRGADDFYYIAFWVTVFTCLRATVMSYVLAPFARWCGIRKEKATIRFTEQAWLLVYYLVFWPLGMVYRPIRIAV